MKTFFVLGRSDLVDFAVGIVSRLKAGYVDVWWGFGSILTILRPQIMQLVHNHRLKADYKL